MPTQANRREMRKSLQSVMQVWPLYRRFRQEELLTAVQALEESRQRDRELETQLSPGGTHVSLGHSVTGGN